MDLSYPNIEREMFLQRGKVFKEEENKTKQTLQWRNQMLTDVVKPPTLR